MRRAHHSILDVNIRLSALHQRAEGGAAVSDVGVNPAGPSDLQGGCLAGSLGSALHVLILDDTMGRKIVPPGRRGCWVFP